MGLRVRVDRDGAAENEYRVIVESDEPLVLEAVEVGEIIARSIRAAVEAENRPCRPRMSTDGKIIASGGGWCRPPDPLYDFTSLDVFEIDGHDSRAEPVDLTAQRGDVIECDVCVRLGLGPVERENAHPHRLVEVLGPVGRVAEIGLEQGS